MNYLDSLVQDQKAGNLRGIPSICSAHPIVLEAVFRFFQPRDLPVLIEATCNQVNQFGGYTGMTPADFVRFVEDLAASTGFPRSNLLLGGDHLGPLPWSNEPAESAMQKAKEMVRAYALAGFSKIHLDCSTPCADDGDLAPEVMAQRTAELAVVAEEICKTAGLPLPHYVIGTEVPAAGGAKEGHELFAVTHPKDAAHTIEITRQAFASAGLEDAWNRVIALVVQPGVEFDQDKIFAYDRPAAKELAAFIETVPGLVYEAHSTDYQCPSALKNLVQDHFAILKVGPGLTFALREAVFALAEIENQLCDGPSDIRAVVEAAMLAKPAHWEKHYSGDARALKLARQYSFSDRIRYYWTTPQVQAAFDRLISNLQAAPIPLTMLSQYLPDDYRLVRGGIIENKPREFLVSGVMRVLEDYSKACFGE